MARDGRRRPGTRSGSSGRTRGKPARARDRHRRGDGAEWVGGVQRPPSIAGAAAEAEDGAGPALVLWVELPAGSIVASELRDPRSPATASFADTLAQAIAAPLTGPPRRPPRVRVADPALAAELRAVFADLEVVVAATPELDELTELLTSGLGGGGGGPASYLEDGRHDAARVATLFEAAEKLWSAAPWRTIDDDLLFRVDAPELALDGACLSIIGALGEVRGFVLFASHAAYEAFFAVAEARQRGAATTPGLGASALSLTFAPGAELPPSMTREVARHGWPVASAVAYPLPDHRDPVGAPLPLAERDLRVLTACAGALALLCRDHGEALGSVQLRTGREPLATTYVSGGLELRLAVPFATPRAPTGDAN